MTCDDFFFQFPEFPEIVDKTLKLRRPIHINDCNEPKELLLLEMSVKRQKITGQTNKQTTNTLDTDNQHQHGR